MHFISVYSVTVLRSRMVRCRSVCLLIDLDVRVYEDCVQHGAVSVCWPVSALFDTSWFDWHLVDRCMYFCRVDNVYLMTHHAWINAQSLTEVLWIIIVNLNLTRQLKSILTLWTNNSTVRIVQLKENQQQLQCRELTVLWSVQCIKVCCEDVTNNWYQVGGCCWTAMPCKCKICTFASQQACWVCSAHLRPIVHQLLAINTSTQHLLNN